VCCVQRIKWKQQADRKRVVSVPGQGGRYSVYCSPVVVWIEVGESYASCYGVTVSHRVSLRQMLLNMAAAGDPDRELVGILFSDVAAGDRRE